MSEQGGQAGQPGQPGKEPGGGRGGRGGAGGRGSRGSKGETGGRGFRLKDAVPVVLAAASILFTAWLFTRMIDEGQERRDQNCILFEGQQADAVRRLVTTYRYLEGLPRAEYGTNLTAAIIRGLSAQEAQARADRVPPYCDEPGVGLSEPSLEVPERRTFDVRRSGARP